MKSETVLHAKKVFEYFNIFSIQHEIAKQHCPENLRHIPFLF